MTNPFIGLQLFTINVVELEGGGGWERFTWRTAMS